MVIGFIGSGNMAAAMARGWAGEFEGMLFSDAGSGRAKALAEELGGEALGNSQVAERADLLVLAVKPAKLAEVAPELQAARRVVSILAAVPVRRVAAGFPEAEVLRLMPNVGVEVRKGVLCVAGEASEATRAKLELLGHVVDLPDEDFDEATAVMSCAPAYLALAVEALADAGAAAGLDAELARELVVETTAGTAELLRVRHPADVRRAVASPGGSTEAGLEALDREGARGAFEAAVAASLERMRR
jgi:pyrroline-5-carboxylate reductase